MKTYTKEQIEEKVNELWEEDFSELEIETSETLVRIRISRMFSPPGLSFAQLKALSEFFETERINDADRFGEGGCETCDYGSSYGFELEIS